MNVVVNGRFTTQPLTGVQRYAREISSRLSDRLQVVSPANWGQGWKGHFWEQVGLPWKVRGNLVWSPGNTGPLCYSRQVVTIHDCAVFDSPEGFTPRFQKWYRWLLPRLARTVRRILTVSEFSRQRIAEHCGVPLSRIVAIPNGVDARFHHVDISQQEEVRQRFGLPKNFVLCVGSLEPRKNLRLLLRAWQQASRLHQDFALVLVGGTANYYRQAGLEQLPERVLLAGRVADADLPAIYSAATMFVYPSLYEGFGLTVLEAMACGTPVICSRTTALPEVAGEAAVLIDPENEAELAAAMIELAESQILCSKLRQLGRQRCQQFSWDTAAEQTWNVLQQAADES